MRRTGQDVVDYVAYMEHLAWVNSVCDTTVTAMAAFRCFRSQNMSSVARGAEVMDRDRISTLTGSTALESMMLAWEGSPTADDRDRESFRFSDFKIVLG